jgi:SAM-dependent methyltransferase
MLTNQQLRMAVLLGVCETPSLQEIAAEWDSNVPERARELERGIDASFREVIYPTTRSLLRKHGVGHRAIDVGCGLGYPTNLLSELGYVVEGIDISPRSIEYASQRFPHLRFTLADVCSFSYSHQQEFDVCLADMVLHNLTDLDESLSSIYRMLRGSGILLASIPHPAFWPPTEDLDYIYPRFDYLEERSFKVPFKIRSGAKHPSSITYFHRSISRYIKSFCHNGFRILDSVEPRVEHHNCPDLMFFVCSRISPNSDL